MTSVTLPSHCPSCGAIFASRAYSISGKSISLSDNTEMCPFCGEEAYLAEGVFDIAENMISIISAPDITKEMLMKLGAAVQEAYKKETGPEELIRTAESIDPKLATAVKNIVSNKKLYFVGLFILAMAIKQCSLDSVRP